METTVFSGTHAVVQLLNLLLIALIGYLIFKLCRKRMAAEKPHRTGAASKPVSEILKARRLERKLSQEFVAEQLGVSRQAVSKWESGSSLPSTANLLALAKLLQIPADELMREGN